MNQDLHGLSMVIAYHGARFRGWQRQPGLRTVQGVLEDAVRSMDAHASLTRGASRTDGGVHALGQVAAFDTRCSISLRGWFRGLNAALPGDVAIQSIDACEPGYAPRFGAIDKTYRYDFLTGDVPHPMWSDRAWFLGPSRLGHALDVDAMREAAAMLRGTHDFRAFQGRGDEKENTVRTMLTSEVETINLDDVRLVRFTVRGDAFLKHMVRNIAGTLLEVGQKKRSPASLAQLCTNLATRQDAGPTAPPQGLTLVKARCGPERPQPHTINRHMLAHEASTRLST